MVHSSLSFTGEVPRSLSDSDLGDKGITVLIRFLSVFIALLVNLATVTLHPSTWTFPIACMFTFLISFPF